MFDPKRKAEGAPGDGSRTPAGVPSRRVEQRDFFDRFLLRDYSLPLPPREPLSSDAATLADTTRYRKTIMTLNTKVFAAECARFGLHVSLAAAGPALMLSTESNGVLAWSAGVTALSALSQVTVAALVYHGLVSEPCVREERDPVKRITAITKEISERAGVPMPLIRVVRDDSARAIMVKRILGVNVLKLTTGILETLNDRELRGVVAHELAHDRLSDILPAKVGFILDMFAQPTLFFGVGALTYTALAGGFSDTLVTISAVAAAVAAWGIANGCLNFLSHFISRQSEFKADLRAVKVTQDPQGFIDGLTKISPKSSSDEENAATQSYPTHPSLKARVDLIRRVFAGELAASNQEA